MGERTYMLIEVPVERRLWPDRDLIVRVMEYVRQNIRSLLPEIPAECEVDLLATGTAHNTEPRPILGLHAPTNALDAVPDRIAMDVLGPWCDSLSNDDLRSIGLATDASTWNDLVLVGVHPPRG